MYIYHVFTNNHDEWVENADEAYEIYRDFKHDYGCARLYREEQDTEGELINEECIESFGSFPW